jgi:predicted lipoprotein with Yx(FWY)xxD motif
MSMMPARRLFVALIVATAGSGALALQDVAWAQDTTKRTVTVRSSDYGRILFDGSNRVLYAFTRDPSRKSTCYGACAAAWPPYIFRGRPQAGQGATGSLLGTTIRRDGRRQVTYAGKPLYYYVHDGPGQVLCQNVREYGGLWLVVRPSGRVVR